MYYIGVDLGTSAVKMLLMDKQGDVKKIVSESYPLYMDDRGWSEQNPADWWTAFVKGVKELIAGVNPSEIKSMSFSGQMHGMVTLDENDNIIRNAILWNDQRTVSQCDYLNSDEKVGRQRLIDNVANIALTGFTAPKILWLKENEPDNFKRVKKYMLPKDYLAYKLSDVFATDFSDGSGMLLLDVKNKCYSKFMLDVIGISEAQLPKLFESFNAVGTVSEKASKETGLSTSTKVVIGGGDQAVGAVGTGTVSNNSCSISLGTSGVVFVASDECKIDYEKSAIHSFCHASGKYHMMGVTLAAAASNKWWIEDIMDTTDYGAALSEAEKAGQNKIYYLPYLTGERTPINDSNARGVFVGMTSNTSRGDMTRAVIEGVTFSLCHVLKRIRELGIDVQKARIIGGGAKSDLWCQIIADAMGVEIEKIHSEEGPALGAAILAAVGDGAYATVEEATTQIMRVVKSYKANPSNKAYYDHKFKNYLEIYERLAPMFPSL